MTSRTVEPGQVHIAAPSRNVLRSNREWSASNGPCCFQFVIVINKRAAGARLPGKGGLLVGDPRS